MVCAESEQRLDINYSQKLRIKCILEPKIISE